MTFGFCRFRLGVAMLFALAMIRPALCDPRSWPDTFKARLELLALVETVNSDVLASRSATATLEGWCAAHAMADPPKLRAELVRGAPSKTATAEQRKRLGIGPGERVVYRNVRLICGSHVLSEADNWYVPARLTPAMNEALETTEAPFGRVVAPLKPERQTFFAALSFHPLPVGWEMHAPDADHPGETISIPRILFEHRAVLYAANRLPFSEVDEHYTREILDFDHAKLKF